MKRLIVSLLALCCTIALWAEPGVDRLMQRSFRGDGPGAVAVVVERSGVAHLKGYGLADVAHHIAMTEKTRFDLASVSKQFTAVSILLLASRGQLSLDNDVHRFLPELPHYAYRVTLADMMHHVSGLPEYEDDGSGLPDPGKMTNLDTLREVAAHPKLDFRPRSKFAYTNANYSLLGLIVERISKRSLRDFLATEIFNPLGMATADVQDANHHERDFAVGYQKQKNGRFTPDRVLVTATGDGNVFMSMGDFIKWDAAVRRRAIIPAGYWTMAFTSGRLLSDESTHYGFAYGVDTENGHLCYSHNGGWNGTSTYFAMYPDDGLTIAVFSNIDDAVDDDLMSALAALYLH